MNLHHRAIIEPVALNPLLAENSLPPDLRAAVALVEAGLATRVILVGLPLPVELRESPYHLYLGAVQIEARFTPSPEEPVDLVVSKYVPATTAEEMPVKLYERLASS
jgi:hypothetical protein